MHQRAPRLAANTLPALLALLALASSGLAQKPSPPPVIAPKGAGPAAGSKVTEIIHTTLEAANRSGVVAEDFVFKATLKLAKPGPSPAGREISFTLKGAPACKGTTDANGVASCHFTIPALAQTFHPYEARFAGGPGLFTSKVEARLFVGKAQTKLTISAPENLVPGQELTFSSMLRRDLDDSPMDGKLVSYSVDGKSIGSATTSHGSSLKKWTIPGNASGNLKFEVFFATDDYYVGSSAQVTRSISRKAYLRVVSAPSGVVGGSATYKAQLTKLPYIPGVVVPGIGIAGERLKFIFDHHHQGSDEALGWNSSATTDAQGFAAVTEKPKITAHQLRVRLDSTGGWKADEISHDVSIRAAETAISAPPLSGNIGKAVTVKAHVKRTSDGEPRKYAKLTISKIGSTTLNPPIRFSADGSGNASYNLTLISQWGIGSKSLTLTAESDPNYKAATITVPLTIGPSQ